MKIKIADLNSRLIRRLQEEGLDAECDDYFRVAYRTKRPVLMTASNPMWTFGGGIDAVFAQHFPKLVELKQLKGGAQERISNICFCITVGSNLKADRETVKRALKFAKSQTAEDEVLVMSGVGTGIGGLDIETFAGILKEI